MSVTVSDSVLVHHEARERPLFGKPENFGSRGGSSRCTRRRPPVCDHRATTSSAPFRGCCCSGVAASSSTSSRRLSLLVLPHLPVLLHLLCLPGAAVRGLDVHEHTNSGTKTTRIAARETNSKVPEPDSTPTLSFTGTTKEDETRVTATSPARRLRQENKEPAQQVDASATSRDEASPTSTDPSPDRRSKALEAEAAGYYKNSPTQYLVMEANGVGDVGSGEGLMSKRATSTAHADRGWRQPGPPDGEWERDTSNRDFLRKPPHLQQPIAIGGSHSHFEQQRRGSYASAATGGDAGARRESGSGSSRAASRHTSEQLTVDAATASSEWSSGIHTFVAGNLIDNDISMDSYAHTGDKRANAAVSLTEGIGQKCPWWQLDLGATKTVDKVKLSAPLANNRMRRLLYVLPMTDGGEVEYANKPMSDTTGTRQGGVRVLVGNSPRDRAHTSAEYPSSSGRFPGNGMGLICTEPPTGEVCETIQCENPDNCLERFAPVPLPDGTTDYTIDHLSIGTAEVNCNGKQGRYVTIELPGLTTSTSDSDKIRCAGLTEVRVEGGPAQPTEDEDDDVDEQETQTTSDMDTYLIFGGVAFVLVAVIGVLLAQGGSQGGRSRPVDAAAFAENEY